MISNISDKYALLIDGDNISGNFIKEIMDISTDLGTITYRRAYGNWTNNQMSEWKNVLQEYSITPMQQFANVSGKNATDTALIIDAMDILYSGNVQGFVIVSSDSDFTRLAQRLKESGMVVVGIGMTQTPIAFKNACTKFCYLKSKEKIVDAVNDAESNTKKVKKSSESAEKKTTTKKKKIGETAEENPSITPLETIKDTIDRILLEYRDDNNLVIASTINDMLHNKIPDFNYHNYGYGTFSRMLKEMGYTVSNSNSNSYVKYEEK